MFDKIEQQSESKLILDQLEESLLITSESDRQIEFVNDHFLDNFQSIIEQLEINSVNRKVSDISSLMAADKTQVLFDFGIDEKVIK